MLEHVDGLVDAASIDRDTYGYTDVPGERGAMSTYVERLVDDHADGRVLPFAQRRLDTGELVGCTRFMEPRWWRGRHDPDEIEIGGTWLASTAQRTPINTEAKYSCRRTRSSSGTSGGWRSAPTPTTLAAEP